MCGWWGTQPLPGRLSRVGPARAGVAPPTIDGQHHPWACALAQLTPECKDLLNRIFHDDWQPLDWRFNVLNPLPAHESMHPAIVHYTGFRQPWKLGMGPGTAFGRTYRHVMTNAVYYRFLAERSLAWLRPVIGWFTRSGAA